VHREATARRAADFTIGEEPACDFQIPAEHLSGGTRMTLVEIRSDGAVAAVPPGATGEVVFPGGRIVPLEGIAGGRIPLEKGRRAVMTLGPWTFLVRATERRVPFKAAAGRRAWAPNLFTGVSVVLHALFFGVVSLIPPGVNGLLTDPGSSDSRFAKYLVVPREVRMETLPDLLEKKERSEDKDLGVRHKGVAGKAGDRNAPVNDKRYGIKGPSDTRNIRMARDASRDLARSAGILQFLHNAAGPVSPFGSDNPVGRDPENALGGLLGDEIGNSFGYNGLAMYGTGRGGGGDGTGTIGIGNLNSITGGFIRGDRDPYKNRPLNWSPDRAQIGVRVKGTGGEQVRGSISKETIRRLVQRQLPQIKFCYEKGLSRRPDLEGRVSVKFVISPKGVVQSAAVAESSLGDAAVEQCIAGAVSRISFPQPADGGVVIATYPFALTSPNN
jgi:TonB family protein